MRKLKRQKRQTAYPHTETLRHGEKLLKLIQKDKKGHKPRNTRNMRKLKRQKRQTAYPHTEKSKRNYPAAKRRKKRKNN